jgi:hypothetical protein
VVLGAYAGVGSGVLFLLLLGLLGLGLLAWIIYWATRGFRTGPPKSPRNPKWWLARLAPLLALMICFPPMRRAGNWSDQATSLRAPESVALEFDRSFFGYIPSYRWIGQVGEDVHGGLGPVVTSDERKTQFRSDRQRWAIDWSFLGGQLAILAVLLLPFFRARANSHGT